MCWKAKLSYIALCAVALTACKNDDPEVDSNIPPFSNAEYAVYMAFTYDSIPSATAKSIQCSGIWSNGVNDSDLPSVRKLSPGRDEGVQVCDICVGPDNILYAAGYFGKAALYWQGDKEVELPEGLAATGIGVAPDGTVYTCGFEKEGSIETAKMWVGTTPTLLKNGTRANKLCLYNNKCYIAGYGNNPENYAEEARIWIDGQSYNKLSQDKESIDNTAIANDIIANEHGWWCVGRERSSVVGFLPKVWINRSNNNLIREGAATSLNCVDYENDIYYIAGNDGNHAKYWSARQKSEKENRIVDCVEFDLSDGSTFATVEDIDVVNGIVACCGYVRSNVNSYIPKLWINGKEIPLGEKLNKYSNVLPCAVVIVRR